MVGRSGDIQILLKTVKVVSLRKKERSRKCLLRPFHVRENDTINLYRWFQRIPAKYGGFETFVEKLTEFQQDKDIQYYVACMRENSAKSGLLQILLNITAICYNIDVPNIGPARAIAYDIAAS